MLVRWYADDYVVCFKREADARCFRIEMERRLGLIRVGNRIAEDQDFDV